MADTSAEDLADVERLKDNIQKLGNHPRTNVLDIQKKKYLTQILNAVFSDLGPLPVGWTITYPMQTEIGSRLALISNKLMPDGSQRHNLDHDIREFEACYLNLELPAKGGIEFYDHLGECRWRNLRTARHSHPEPATEEEITYFDLGELVESGHVKFADPPEDDHPLVRGLQHRGGGVPIRGLTWLKFQVSICRAPCNCSIRLRALPCHLGN